MTKKKTKNDAPTPARQEIEAAIDKLLSGEILPDSEIRKYAQLCMQLCTMHAALSSVDKEWKGSAAAARLASDMQAVIAGLGSDGGSDREMNVHVHFAKKEKEDENK